MAQTAGGLPTRADTHVTGEQAVLALRNSLPRHWIFRERECLPDYGIDCEVEIVTCEGATTGAIVKGQVKGCSPHVKHVRGTVSVAADTVRYWVGMPIPVIIVRVAGDPATAKWLDARHYLAIKGKLDSLYTSPQKSYSFNFKGAPRLPDDAIRIEELALQHQKDVKDMRVSAEQQAAGDFIGYFLLIRVFGGDVEKWIKWLRENGSDDQLLHDFPFVAWVKDQSQRDAGFMDLVRQMVEEYGQEAKK